MCIDINFIDLAGARGLVEERANVVISDPKALDNARKDLADLTDYVSYEDDPYIAAEGSHAIAVMTEWSNYKDLDYKRIYDSMEKPAFIFDGRNLLDHQKLFDIGFNVFTIGKGPLKHI